MGSTWHIFCVLISWIATQQLFNQPLWSRDILTLSISAVHFCWRRYSGMCRVLPKWMQIYRFCKYFQILAFILCIFYKFLFFKIWFIAKKNFSFNFAPFLICVFRFLISIGDVFIENSILGLDLWPFGNPLLILQTLGVIFGIPKLLFVPIYLVVVNYSKLFSNLSKTHPQYQVSKIPQKSFQKSNRKLLSPSYPLVQKLI